MTDDTTRSDDESVHVPFDDPDAPVPPAPVVAARALRQGRPKPGMVKAFARFAVVGGVGTVVNLAVLHLLHSVLGLGFTRSSAIATEIAIITNYLGNELWTFHLRRLSWRRLLKYNAAALVGLLTTVVVATLVKDFTHPLLAQLLGIGAGAGVNFAMNFGWIWRR